MLQVLNKDSESVPKSCYEQLEEMGFSSRLIRQADYQSKEKTVSGLLNWLLTHGADADVNEQADLIGEDDILENPLRKSKKKAKNARKLKNSGLSEELYSLEKLAGDINQDLYSLAIKPTRASKKIQSNTDELLSKPKAKLTSPQSCPIQAQRLSPEALIEVKKTVKDLEEGNTSNSNENTRCVNEILKRWKYSQNNLDVEIAFALSYEELREEPLINLRSKLYQLVDKIFNMRIRKDAVLDLSAIETMLMNLHDLGVFSKGQIEKAKISYIKFCRKMKVPENEMLITQLESKTLGSGRRGLPKFSLNSLEDGPEHGDASVLKIRGRFSRLSDEEGDSEEKPQIETAGGSADEEKELCIICMDRIREIVYIPCAHFLACPLCSPCVSECPICSKKIEKRLRIYWC